MLSHHYKSTLLVFNQISLDGTNSQIYENLEILNLQEAAIKLDELRDSAATI